MSYLRNWLQSRLAMRRMRVTKRLLRRSERRAERMLRTLEKRRKQLSAVSARLSSVSKSVVEDLEDAERAQSQYQETIDALRSELRVLSEVTIPALTAAHKLILERYDAETAISVRNRVFASPDIGRYE